MDFLDTPRWRAGMHALYSATHPDAVQWRNMVRFYSDSLGAENGALALWDYLESVICEVGDPARSAQKMQEFIESSHAAMIAPPGENFTHNSYLYALTYSRAEQHLDPKRKAQWRAGQIDRCLRALGTNMWGVNVRVADSDLLVGAWAMILATDTALGTNLRNYAAEGTSFSAMTAAVERYLQAAAGGEWIESTQYNLGTNREIATAIGFAGLANFPTIQNYLTELAEQCRWHHTPDLQDVVQWGDEEHPHALSAHYRAPLYHVLHGLGFDPSGHLLHLAKAIQPQVDSAFWIAHQHSLLTFDPSLLPAEPQVVPPLGLRQSANGLVLYRTATDLVQVFCPVPIGVDHQMVQWDVRWYSKGAWLLDHPLGYMPTSRTQNGSECYGFTPPITGLEPALEYADGCFVRLSAKHPSVLPGWDPAPPFIHDWLRTVELAGGRIEVRDKIAADMPTRLDRFYGGQATFDGRVAPLAQFWHAPPGSVVQEVSGGFTWQDKAGRQVSLKTNATSASLVKAEIGVNVGTYMYPEESGGTIIQLGAESEIISSFGLAQVTPPVEPPPVEPPPVEPPPVEPVEEIELKVCYRPGTKEIVIKLT
jgi:hypothetical protein